MMWPENVVFKLVDVVFDVSQATACWFDCSICPSSTYNDMQVQESSSFLIIHGENKDLTGFYQRKPRILLGFPVSMASRSS